MKFILIFALDIIAQSLIAQLPTLAEKLQGKDRLEEIMDIVEQHYAEITSGVRPYNGEPRYKQWMRWGYYMSFHTDGEGRLVDVESHLRKAYANYTATQRISTGNWVSKGPLAISGTYGSAAGIGRVDRVAFHPTDPNTIYIGTPTGGLLKSTNGGSTWTAMTDNIPSLSVSGIAVSNQLPNVVYILTGDGDSNIGGLVENSGYIRSSAGVFVSVDGGVNWQRTADFPVASPFVSYNLAIDPNNTNVLLAATSSGIFRTTNGGDSWSQVLTGRTYEIKYKPGSSTTAYATQNGAFFRSDDGGAHWSHVTNFDNTLLNGRVALAVTQQFPTRVYLLSGWAPASEVDNCGDDPSQDFGGVFISLDSGMSFHRQCNTPNVIESCCDGTNSRSQSDYDLAIAASHSNGAYLMTGALLAWKSTDSGVNWSNAMGVECNGQTTSFGYLHTDIHDVEYNPLNNQVFVCSDGGLVKSIDNGTIWLNVSEGIAASEVYHLAGTTADIDNLIIGLQDNGCKRRNANTTTWDNAVGGDGFDCIYNWGSATAGYMTSNSSVYRFQNNGTTTTNITIGDGQFFTRVTSAINNPNLVLAGRSDIYKSLNAGTTWTNTGASGFWDLERCPSNSSRFYAAGGSSAFATTGSMYRSSDLGDTWIVISGNPGYPTASIRLTDIGVRPTASGNVWITFGGFSAGNKVFYSSDAGVTWVNKSGSLPNVPINAIAVDANNNVYIGTDIGVFYRASSMTDWVPFWHRLPIIPVTDLELYESDGIIRAGTFGRGVWESSTYSTCASTLAIVAGLSGNRYYETSNWITCSSLITGGQNTRLILKAANSVTLTTGFEAKKGNTVHVYTASCGIAVPED